MSAVRPDAASAPTGRPRRGLRFWAVIAALGVMSLLTALENTVVSTSFPAMLRDLRLGEEFVWVANVFFLTSAAVQPLLGQLAEILGRRHVTIAIIVLFLLGSGVAGGATNAAMLMAGRALQGVGSGGLNMLVEVIVSDMVPLRERGGFMAIILTVYSLGSSAGPVLGGVIVSHTYWGWVFYINLPIGGVALIMVILFLHTKHQPAPGKSFWRQIGRVDFIGNGIIMVSTVSVLMALVYAGTRNPWSSWKTLVPLLVGIAGLGLFIVYEGSGLPAEPVTPVRLFATRTAVVVYINTFLCTVLLYWIVFFLPVYFQAVQRSSPTRAGVQFLPTVMVAVPGAVISVVVLTKYGKYKALHFTGFGLMAVGLGLMTRLEAGSSAAAWIGFQIIASLGAGMLLSTLLPAFQAATAESDQASATASWSFIRSFANIWAVTIPAAILNSRVEALKGRISDPVARQLLSHGRAYELATSAFVLSHQQPARDEIVGVYTNALQIVWAVSAVFAAVPFLLVFFERQLLLRSELETVHGLQEHKATSANEPATSARPSTGDGDHEAAREKAVAAV